MLRLALLILLLATTAQAQITVVPAQTLGFATVTVPGARQIRVFDRFRVTDFSSCTSWLGSNTCNLELLSPGSVCVEQRLPDNTWTFPPVCLDIPARFYCAAAQRLPRRSRLQWCS